VNLLDASTFNNFFEAFPIMKLFLEYNYGHLYEYSYIGTLTVEGECIIFTNKASFINSYEKLTKFNVYENYNDDISETMKKINVNDNLYLLINENELYIINGSTLSRVILMTKKEIYNHYKDDYIYVSLTIKLIRKEKYVTDSSLYQKCRVIYLLQ